MDWTGTAWAMSVTVPRMATHALRTWIPMISGARVLIVASRGKAPPRTGFQSDGVEYHIFAGPLRPDKYIFMWKLLYDTRRTVLIKLDTDTVVSPLKVALFWKNTSRDAIVYAGSTRRTYKLFHRHFDAFNFTPPTPYMHVQGGFEMFTRAAFSRAQPCWTRIRPEHVRDPLISHSEDALIGLCMGASMVPALDLAQVSPWRVLAPECRNYMAFHQVKRDFLKIFEDCVSS